MQAVRKYILDNWTKTFHDPSEMRGDFTVPKPYISPSIGGIYTDLYYWDVYFTNLGLMEDGFDEQVENNLDNMAYFIDVLGFMPNANTLTDRSQPPLFCSSVYDYYVHKGDKAIIEKYMPYILKEYEFWETQRKTPFGLNNFSTNADAELKLINYGLAERVIETREDRIDKILLAEDLMAIAESGLDFNMRFKTARSKVDAKCFLHLDLNCFLFEMEKKAAKMLSVVGKADDAAKFEKNADKRKALIEKYFYDKSQGIYLDYNYVDGKFSEITSAVSVYPYAYGISEDKVGLKKVIKPLEFERGITVAPFRGKEIYFQWDYPCMWPAATCIIYMALKRLGLIEDAERIAKKYMAAVDDSFIKTGRLWEKYDATTGGIGQSFEYDTPEMMGWTAGVYVYFDEELKRVKR